MKLGNYLAAVVFGSLLVTGCQSTSEKTQAALTNAKTLNGESVRALISQHTAINTHEDELTGRFEYVNQVNASIATQILELTTKPKPLRYSFTMTAKLYDADSQAFFIPLDTLALLKAGAITKEEAQKVAVFSSNNLFDSNVGLDMTDAAYNQQIMKGIALGQYDDELSDHQKDFRVASLRRRVFFSGYSADPIENLISFNELIFEGKDLVFQPHERFRQGRSTKRTWRAAFMLNADKEQAKNMIGKEYSITFIPAAAFEIKKTGQLVVLGLKGAAALENDQGRWIDGTLATYYHSYVPTFSEKTLKNFTCERVTNYVKYDSKESPSRLRDCNG